MLSHSKSHFESYLEPLVKQLRNVNPNVITVIGSIPSLLFFVFMTHHWYLPALVVYLASAIDMLDGMVARKYNKETAFGGFLDSFVDRIADFLVITSFAYAGIVRWEIAAPLLLAAFLTSYARSRGELANRSVSFAIGFIERTERLFLIFLALLAFIIVPGVSINGYNLAEIIFFLTTILSFYTVIERVIFAQKKL